MLDIFQPKTTGYNLRNGSLFIVPCAKNNIGLKSFQFQATLAYNNLLNCYKYNKLAQVQIFDQVSSNTLSV